LRSDLLVERERERAHKVSEGCKAVAPDGSKEKIDDCVIISRSIPIASAQVERTSFDYSFQIVDYGDGV